MAYLSISKKLFLLRIGVGLCMGVLIGGIAIGIGMYIMHRYLVGEMESSAQMVADQVRVVVNLRGQHLEDVADLQILNKYYHTGRTELLTELFRDHLMQFQRLVFVDKDGIQEVAVTGEDLDEEELPFTVTDGYRAAQESPKKVMMGMVSYDQELKEPALRFYYQQMNFFDNNLGLIQGSVTLESLGRSLNKVFQQEEQQIVVITDHDGRIVFSTASENPNQTLVRGAETVRDIFKEPLDHAAYLGWNTINGKSYLVSAIHLLKPNWHLFVLKPTGFIVELLYVFISWCLLAILVILACGEFTSRRLGLKILEPIRKFNQVTTDILESGDLDKQVKWKSGDEMGQLVDSFNTMLKKIRAAQKEKELADEKLQTVQEELFKTEKMAVVGQMSGLIAHEILNPISAVYARLDLMAKDEKNIAKIHQLLGEITHEWNSKIGTDEFSQLVAQKGQKELELMEKIAKAISDKEVENSESRAFIFTLIQRTIQIVNNLREMSRRETILEQVDLVQLIDEVAGDQADGLRKRNIEVKTEYEVHPTIHADHMEIYSIFANLFKNAAQAIVVNSGSTEKQIHISLTWNEDQIQVQFKDTGSGIEPENLNKLFELGFSTRGREGTGIGLSHSRKIARQLGGDLIVLQSEPGQGTTFQVNFISQGKEHDTQVDK